MRDVMLITHFIGLAMGLGTSFAFMFIGMATNKMESSSGQTFMVNGVKAISNMGHIGLGLLFISGGYLMTPYWSQLTSTPTLLIKLILFLVLGALVGILSSTGKKAAKGNAEVHLKKMRTLGPIALITGLAMVALAVMTFH